LTFLFFIINVFCFYKWGHLEDLDIWPKKIIPRAGQLEVAEKLYDLVKRNKKVILNAPTGWGKTLVTLIALKKSGKLPILWLVRSLSVGERVLEDAEKIGLNGFIAGGRDKTCLYKGYKNDIDIYYFCKYSRFKCPFFIGLRKHDVFKNLKSFMEIVKLGKEEFFCPYYAQEYYIYRSDIIIQNYYRKRPRIFSSLVIDEAHNILAPREIRISVSSLLNALNELLRSDLSRKARKQVESLLKFITLEKTGWDLYLFFNLETLEEIETLYLKKIIEGIKTDIGYFIKLYGCIIAYRENDYFSIIKLNKNFEWSPTIYVSGTFLGYFKNFLKVDAEIKVSWRKKLNGFILGWVTTRYSELERNINEYKKILTLLKLLNRVVVFASERVISLVKNYATFTEDNLLNLPKKWQGILLLKTRGKFSEGVDIDSDAVMILGAPYLTPPVISKLFNVYKKIGYLNARELSSDVPMLVATLQCIGRALRSPESKPLIILADYRFYSFKKFLNEYLDLYRIDSLIDFKKIILEYKSKEIKV